MRRWLGMAAAVALGVAVAASGATAAGGDPLKDLEGGGTASASAGRDIRVQITARTATTIGADMTGRLAQFPLKDGDRFKSGQVLARFDCALPEGSLVRARAALGKSRAVLDTNQKLRKLGSNSGLELEIAAADEREAEADVTVAQAVVARCTVTAPFSGRVAAVMAHEFQHVAEGAPLLDILDDHSLELELIVPSRWLAWLKPGTRFGAAIDETGHTYQAEITRISGRVDAVSQSIKVYGRMVDSAPELLPGMSGRALFPSPAP